MKKVIVNFVFFLAWGGVSSCPSMAEPLSPSSGLVTSQVAAFQEQEHQLLDALASDNRKTIEKLLHSDFEQLAANDLNRSIFLDEFLKDSHKKNWQHLTIVQMSVRHLGHNALVTFALKPVSPKKKGWFVNDLWVNEQDKWRLKNRFIGPLGPSHEFPPGVSASETTFDKLY